MPKQQKRWVRVKALTVEEKALFEQSVAAVRGLVAELPPGHALPAGPR